MKVSVQRYRDARNLKNALRRRIVSSKLFIPILFGVSMILLACLLVWQRVYVIGLVGEVAQYEEENRQLKDLLKKAEIESIELSRLSRIEKIAGERLGLEKIGAQSIYTLNLDRDYSEQESLGEIIASLKKIADNLPVLSETNAETIQILDLNDEEE